MKNKRMLLSFLILTVFLMPLMGNNVVAVPETYYFDNHDSSEEWETYPEKMVDGNEYNYSSTTIDGDVQLCDDNSYDGNPPFLRISKVEIRAKAYSSATSARGRKINLTPVFGGTTDGDNYSFIAEFGPPGAWSHWFDITNDPNGPGAGNWAWSDIDDLDMDVKADLFVSGTDVIYCSKVEIQVSPI